MKKIKLKGGRGNWGMSPVDSIKNERQLKANDEEEVWKRNGPVN